MSFFWPLFIIIGIITESLAVCYTLSDFLCIGNYDINIVIFGPFKFPLPIVVFAPFKLRDMQCIF